MSVISWIVFITFILKTGIMLPLVQSLGTVPLSSIILKSFSYIGINKCSVEIIYSLTISSIPLDLLSFNDFMAKLSSS